MIPLPSSVRSYLREPAVADPPVRVWRDWVLVGASSASAVLEALLRNDAGWLEIPVAWRWLGLLAFVVAAPPALLIRRTRPLLATIWGFAPTMAFGAASALATGTFGGLSTTAVILIVPYALYRWGSGREGAIGLLILLAAGVIGNVSDPTVGLGDWIGGMFVLSIPVQAGLIVRYRQAERARAIDEVKAREREDLARELHDTVAHHVSAIAVQAQAGRALARSDPARALEVLQVIEEAASRTLGEMRAMVGTLRAGSSADMAPQQGMADLDQLARNVPGELAIEIDLSAAPAVGPAVDAAVFRIAQESITNAVRHARRATRVRVAVQPHGDMVKLTVTDDGVHADATNGDGYGLLGMAERANLLGGFLHAGPAPSGRGWQVEAVLPRQAVTP